LAVTKTSHKKGKNPGLSRHEVPQIIMERVSFLLNRLAQRIRESAEEALRPYQITGKHVGVLTVIDEKGSIPQNEAGQCMHIDRTTMVGLVDDLEKKGLVERNENPSDRRAYALTLTAKGREILPKVQKLAFETEREFLSHLPPKDQKELVRILQKLVQVHFTGNPS
jgi:DNA-binding MarR family transcriptional regulator